MDLVDYEAIIALFRPLPRVVEVPKVVERVVDQYITVPEKHFLDHRKT